MDIIRWTTEELIWRRVIYKLTPYKCEFDWKRVKRITDDTDFKRWYEDLTVEVLVCENHNELLPCFKPIVDNFTEADKTAFIKYYKEFCDKDENPSLTDSVLFYAIDSAQKMSEKFIHKINLYAECED
jgi:hypothetical protein